MKNIKVFTGSSHTALTGCILDKLGIAGAPAEVRRSGNAELSVDLGVSVRNEDVYIVQSGSAEINDHLMELLILVNACKLASARRITAVLPYFPYNKQSKKKYMRGSITAKLVANMLYVAGIDHVITMDLHASQIQGFFNKPVDNLLAEPTIAKYLKDRFPDSSHASTVICKNAGGAKRATSLADRLQTGFGLIHREKHHKAPTGAGPLRVDTAALPLVNDAAARSMPDTATGDRQGTVVGEKDAADDAEMRLTLVGNVRGRMCFLVDDVLDSPFSFLEAAEHLKTCGASKVYIVATHGILSGNAVQLLEACTAVDEVIVTNSYPISEAKYRASTKLRIIDISGVLAEAIRRTHNGESISYLFHTAL